MRVLCLKNHSIPKLIPIIRTWSDVQGGGGGVLSMFLIPTFGQSSRHAVCRADHVCITQMLKNGFHYHPPHHHHLSLNHKGRWGTADDFATSFLLFPYSPLALHSGPVHSLMLFSHLFLCLHCLLPPFTVPCKMVLARPDERET